MIVIPMLGKSSRFFDSGYSLPKYQLPIGSKTLFERSVRSFESLFFSIPFVFLVRSDFGAKEFVSSELQKLGIKDFRVIEFATETRGQADSVMLGTADYHDDNSMIVFNIDTVRDDFTLPDIANFGDGFLEVFKGDGDGWSFIKAGNGGSVIETSEKIRISDMCSNGLYGFRRLGDFRSSFRQYDELNISVNGELYIAPLYNLLIAKGMNIRYREVDNSKIHHCGIPKDYEAFLKLLPR
jgi:dTDP-glucose pyrophosphorylase